MAIHGVREGISKDRLAYLRASRYVRTAVLAYIRRSYASYTGGTGISFNLRIVL